jgi:effector-binding domain-containing protein
MEITRTHITPRTLLGMHAIVAQPRLTEFFGQAFSVVATELAVQGETPAGPPVALYRWESGSLLDVTAGFPVRGPVDETVTTTIATLPGGEAVEAIHTGPYESLATDYAAITGWLRDHGLTPSPVMWEEYLVGPESEEDPERWMTRIVFPLAP